MRLLVAVAIFAAPAAAFASEGLVDAAPSLGFDVETSVGLQLPYPEARVPGRALVKLRGLAPEALSSESPRLEKASKLLSAVEERTGVRLQLVRPSIVGWGLYDVRDVSDPKALPSEGRTLELIEQLASDADIAGASDDRWYRVLALPNDAAFGDMWHLDAIGMPSAWDYTTGLSSQRVGVVDTGTLTDHSELSAKAIAGYDFISNSNAAGDGNGRDADFHDEGDGADCGYGYQPDSFHGSHVAGTILASSNNAAGVAGINWGAGLVTARAMGKCGGAISDIMEGAAWMAGANITGVPSIGADKVSVMNLSLGGEGGCSNYEQDVVNFITGAGVVFVAAAGNNGGAVGSPANCSNVVSVAAHGPGAGKPLTNYSSFGSTIEVVAPGGAIGNNIENGVLSVSGPGPNDYAWQQGTSMAAPHVTGAISLLQVFDATLTRADLAQLFAENGDACTGCNGVRALRVDLLLTAIGAVPGDPPAEPPPADDPPVEEPPVTEPPVEQPGDDDSFEPNNGWDERAAIPCGADLSLVMAEGDSDWFKLDAPAAADVEVRVFADVDLDLFLTNGPTDADVLEASTTETGEETVSLIAPGIELGVAVLPWQSAAGSYRLVVSCTGGDAPAEDPIAEPPANGGDGTQPDEPSSPDDEGAAAEGTMTRAERVNGGLRGGCSQASGSAAPVGLLLLGVAAITRWPRRRRRG